ncbi:MAG: carboxypeptidase regulatory-like domain-containing protein, partial [Acidobacteriaceae bacterium]|nr:carboxypeptidase regulatory-like domain-containing protein [Acidobacteriaceae bacterium]
MLRKFACAICVLAAMGTALFAQNAAGTGGISGVVTDASGSVIPGVNVIVENESKGIRRELVTTDAGVFVAPSLVPASGYVVNIDAKGFRKYETRDIQIQVGETVNLTPRLEIAAASTTVEVTVEAPVVDTTKIDVSQVVGSRQIQELPINGRRVDSFVLLAPAVVPDGTFGLLSFRGIAGGNAFLT